MASLWNSRSARAAGAGASRSPGGAGARGADSGATDGATSDQPAAVLPPPQNADQVDEVDKDVEDMGVVAADVGPSGPSSSSWDARAGGGAAASMNPATTTAATGLNRPHLFRNQASQPPPPPPPAPAPPPPPSAHANSAFAFGPPLGLGQQQVMAPQLQQQQQQQQFQQQQQQFPQAGDASLSLVQLRRLVAEFPRGGLDAKPLRAYDFDYGDCGPLEEELDEWFAYQFWQWVRLSAAQKSWEMAWAEWTAARGRGANGGAAVVNGVSGEGHGGHGRYEGQPPAPTAAWDEADAQARAAFVRAALEVVAREVDMAGPQQPPASSLGANGRANGNGADHEHAAAAEESARQERSAAIGRLTYLALGRWADSAVFPAHRRGGNGGVAGAGDGAKGRTVASASQLRAMAEGAQLIASVDGFAVLWRALRRQCEPLWTEDPQLLQQLYPHGLQVAQNDVVNLMTIIYVAVTQAFNDPVGLALTREKLLQLNPSLVQFMLTATTKLRWDESLLLPQTQIFLLFWKSMLLTFGGDAASERAKKETSEMKNEDRENDVITASPLDYHVFRQEITSKYPAYVPPAPLLPLEAENTSFLPPLPNQPTRSSTASNGIVPGNMQSGGASILHQPVHIATPAPSPPPSPGVGGKAGKKQNYQTNQNFPFLYPPLDASSNSAGGKGLAAFQDALVGRKWDGSDIPRSILEAGQLFADRVRMTRATRQLWDERESFLKFERGWEESDDDEIEDLDLAELTLEEKELIGKLDKPKKHKDRDSRVDLGPNPDQVSDETKAALAAIDKFYEEALPHLQSLVIVLLKAVLANVTVLITQATAVQQHPGLASREGNPRLNGGAAINRNNDGGLNGAGDAPEPTEEELDAARSREITAKAVTSILILLLKWFKVSHVLKFEYMTQLLLDSNYLPLVLKLFAHLDIQAAVDSKTDRIENSFFYFCNNLAAPSEKASSLDAAAEAELPKPQPEPEEESEDEAAPPPIRRQRSPPATVQEAEGPGPGPDTGGAALIRGGTGPPARPEVDELGYPLNELPAEPLSDFSRRNLHALINYVRVMQKVCKGKAHRNLLLVQYKSSNILRKSLRVPQPELRLYTLKLFKNQVPYCGRKWRQGNMRVITAVYLHCRPELRDEWLAGSDIDAEVEESLPQEQALRSLTHWFNVRRYPLRMKAMYPGGGGGGEEATGAGTGASAAGGGENGGQDDDDDDDDDARRRRRHARTRDDNGGEGDHRDFFARELERLELSWLAAAAAAGAQDSASMAGDDIADGNSEWERGA